MELNNDFTGSFTILFYSSFFLIHKIQDMNSYAVVAFGPPDC